MLLEAIASMRPSAILFSPASMCLRDWDPNFIDDVDQSLEAAIDAETLERIRSEGVRLTVEAEMRLALIELGTA